MAGVGSASRCRTNLHRDTLHHMSEGQGQDPLNFLTADMSCSVCAEQGVQPSRMPVLADDNFKAYATTHNAQMSRYRRHVRARVLKHLMAAHRTVAERLYPDWVQAHSDQATPTPTA